MTRDADEVGRLLDRRLADDPVRATILGTIRLALMTATTGFMVGVALLNGGSSNAIGGLCNGRPASHTWLDASGQYGPALIDGTSHADDIIGSDGDDTIDAGPGDDVVCGAAGDDFDVCLFGAGDELANCEY